MKFKFKKELGFTLVETLIGVSIFVMISVALTFFARNIWVYNIYIGASLNNADTIRQTLKTMTSEIRSASAANTGSYAVNQATATSFIFYSDIYDNGLKERVRYFLNGNLLQKGVTIPTGNPLDYNLANEKITTLLSSVTSATIFNYYDTNYDGTTAALTFPVDVSVVRLIKVTINIDKDPNRAPITTTFSTQVSLRNVKDNL
jgi:type II secretory pathway pseudopilin PulG